MNPALKRDLLPHYELARILPSSFNPLWPDQ
jgi:hypothetical protein